MAVQRRTVDLSGHPHLVVVYLGTQVRTFAGLKTLFGFGPKIANSAAEKPDGLLLHEDLVWSLFPVHAGMRQYWRDFESLERWTRSEPHRDWWKKFLRDSGGTGFWHETYVMQGGIEAIYDDVGSPMGMLRFAPSRVAKGPMFSSRQRARIAGAAESAPPVSESELSAVE